MVDITDLINNVVDQDFASAGPTFAQIMQAKMDDALEQEKIAVADQVFNGVDPEEQEELEADEDDDIDIDAELELDDEEYTEYEFGTDEDDELEVEED